MKLSEIRVELSEGLHALRQGDDFAAKERMLVVEKGLKTVTADSDPRLDVQCKEDIKLWMGECLKALDNPPTPPSKSRTAASMGGMRELVGRVAKLAEAL